MTQSTQTWVLTGGIKEGLTKYIGESLKESTTTDQLRGKSVVCMGIIPWYNIPNRKNLVNTSSRPPTPSTYYKTSPGHKTSINMQSTPRSIPKSFNVQDADLDNKQTHFFLVDDNHAKTHGMKDFDGSLITMTKGFLQAGITFFL